MREVDAAAINTLGNDVYARFALACRVLLNRAPVVVGVMHLCVQSAPSISVASALNMAPPGAAAAVHVWLLPLEGLDAVPVAQKPQAALLEATEGRLPHNCECNRGHFDAPST